MIKKNRALIVLLLPLFFIVLTQPVLAKNEKSEENSLRKEARSEINDEKNELRDERKASLSALRLETKENRDELREIRKASVSAIKEQFKLKIQTIKDEVKQQIVEKFAEKMNRVSQKRVEHWNRILARLSEILAFISGKLGADNPSVVIATEKLALAQAAVDAQEGKVYVINIGTESALKSNAGQAMSEEQQDLQTISKLVNDARKAVHDALRVLKQSGAISGTPSATPTETPSPTVTPTATPSAVPTL